MTRQSFSCRFEKSEYDYEYRCAEYEYDEHRAACSIYAAALLPATIPGPARSGYRIPGCGREGVREMFLARLKIAIDIGFEIESHFAEDFTTPISIAIPVK